MHMYTYHALYISLDQWQPPWGHKGSHLVGNLTCWRWKSWFTERTWVLDGIVKPLLNQPSLIPNLSLNLMWYKKIIPTAQFNWVRVFLSHPFFFFCMTKHIQNYTLFLFLNLLNVSTFYLTSWAILHPHTPWNSSSPLFSIFPALPHGWLYFPRIIAIIFLSYMLC